MVSKEQERKALAKIREIVEGLGTDSYVGMAFEGVFDIAETNIDNDWGDSLLDMVANRDRQIDEMKRRNTENNDRIEGLENRVREVEADKDVLKLKLAQSDEALIKMSNKCTEHWNMFRAEQDKVEELELEVIKLKAKLYDWMTQ